MVHTTKPQKETFSRKWKKKHCEDKQEGWTKGKGGAIGRTQELCKLVM